MTAVKLEAGSATDVGLVRSNNQDKLLVAEPLYAVADGMGGAAAGEVASAIAVQTLGEQLAYRGGSLSPDDLVEAAQAANRAVWEKAVEHAEMRGMGTTLVAATVVDGPRLAVVNVGDSRLYAMRHGSFQQVTVDHNLVAEMVAEGRISKEEGEIHPRRNIMTRALGVEPEVKVDIFIKDVDPGDRFLLCSDGLPRELSDERISAILRRLADPSEAAKELVHEAKRHGGNDNITVIVLDVVPDPAALADPVTTSHEVVAEVSPPQSSEPHLATAPPAPTPPPASHQRQRRPSPINLRVAAFLLAFLAILAAGAVGVWYYARSAYFVGLNGDSLTVYQGRPGGVLWFKPTLDHVSSVTTAHVLQASLPELRAGVEEPTVAAADDFISNLAKLYQLSRSAALPPSTIPPSTTTTGSVPPSIGPSSSTTASPPTSS
ncbi:MAG: Stp1/IreP family PP2C-type Ser/Thr phosphatase [Acidimicrobiales bacterium]